MYRRSKVIEDRNVRIGSVYLRYIREMPKMEAYSKIAVEEGMSEDNVRKIVQEGAGGKV